MSLYANFSPWSSTCLCPNHWQKKMFLKREKTNSEFYFHNFIFVRVRNQQTNELYFSRPHDDIQALAGIELNAFSNNIMSPDFHNTFQLEKTGPKWSLFWVPEIDFFLQGDWWREREWRGVWTKNVNCKIAVAFERLPFHDENELT